MLGKMRLIDGFWNKINKTSDRPKPKPKKIDKKIIFDSSALFFKNKSNKKYKKTNFAISSKNTFKKR